MTGLRDTEWRRDSDGRVSGAMFFFYHLLHNKVNATFPSYSEWAQARAHNIHCEHFNIIIRESSTLKSRYKDYLFLRNSIFNVSWGEWVIVSSVPFDSLDFTHSFDYGWELKWRFYDLLKHAGGENNRVTFVLLCCQLW